MLLSEHSSWERSRQECGKTVVEFLEEGIILLSPQETSSQYALIISCGVHGNETAPIEMVCDLLKEIHSQKIVPSLPTLIQFGNLEAMKAQERFLDFNLNRLFSGIHKDHHEAIDSQRAVVLEETMNSFCQRNNSSKIWHLDLHTAIRGSYHQKFAIRPFRERPSDENSNMPSLEEISFLKRLGIEAVVQSHDINSTYSSFSCVHNQATSFTMELGKVKPFGKNRKEDFKAAYEGLKGFLSQGKPPQSTTQEKITVYKVVDELIRSSEETILHLKDDYHNFMPIPAGQFIQSTGNDKRVASEGEAVIFPNKKVKIGQRTGLVISPIDNL
jgi:succinylglutamate desuccinylase